MCFSPQADLLGGLVVGGIGVDASRHLRGRRSHLLLAILPLLLGAHQLIEAFVWLGLQGRLPQPVERAALWAYLLVAFVVLPVFVPLSVLALEPRGRRRSTMQPFVLLGAAVSGALGVAMLRHGVAVELRSYHLAYHVQLMYGGYLVALYVLAICGALLFSGYRHVVVFGAVNLIAVAVLARLTMDGFASMWCGYAALAAGLIAIHMRYAKPHRAMPYELT